MPQAEFKDSRTPALAIVARGNQIETVSPSEFHVRSQSRPGVTYKVTVSRGRWMCQCPFWVDSEGRDCIHIVATRIRCGFQDSAKTPETGIVCERCRSPDVARAGLRRNKSGPVPRYSCRTCGSYFSGREGYHKRRSDPETIARALDLYFRGVSFRQVADHFAQAYALRVSPMTVYRWVTHYSRVAAEWLDTQGAKVGDSWRVDETVVNIDGKNKYLWNVMDAETRFLLATHVSRARTMKDTRAPFRKAKKATAVIPTEIRSDGMTSYPFAIRREFGRMRLPTDPPRDLKNPLRSVFSPHRVVPSIRAPESNNLIERLHGSEKDRIKTMRAFDNERGCAALAEGYRVHYDLVRTHLSLGTTPGVAAGIPEIPGFKWAEIIRLATSRIDTSTEEKHSPAE
jgi:putative transposase